MKARALNRLACSLLGVAMLAAVTIAQQKSTPSVAAQHLEKPNAAEAHPRSESNREAIPDSAAPTPSETRNSEVKPGISGASGVSGASGDAKTHRAPPVENALPPVVFPDEAKPEKDDKIAPTPIEPVPSRTDYGRPGIPVLPFVFAGAGGSLGGFLFSLPALSLLNAKVLSKRPHADPLTLPSTVWRWLALPLLANLLYGKREAAGQSGHSESPPSKEHTVPTERESLGDADYALSHDYITADELKRLRSSSLAMSEMSFALGVIGVIAVTVFGINVGTKYWPVAIMAAFVVFSFTLLGTERYHKYRSAYKTQVLLRFDEKSSGNAGDSGGTPPPTAPLTNSGAPSSGTDLSNMKEDLPPDAPAIRVGRRVPVTGIRYLRKAAPARPRKISERDPL